jgi:outer membrane protein assembly factor BamB
VLSAGTELLAVDADGRIAWRSDLKARLGPPAASAQLVVVPAAGGVLHGLDAGTGQPRWQLRPGGEIDAAPVVESKTVYVASRDGTLYAMPLD